MKEVDYLIVGQGLAGTALAQALLHEKQSVVVLGTEARKPSSAVAAGLYNPITGKKMVLTWNAAVLFPLLNDFYLDAEQLLNIKIIHPKKIYRPFTDIQSQNDFWAKSTHDIFDFAEPEQDSMHYEPYIWNLYGGLSTKQSGYVDVKGYISGMHALLLQSGSYQEELFDYACLSLHTDHIQYKNIQAKKIIFAEGYYNRFNPYFNWLPIGGMKGDVLTLSIEDYPLKEVVNKHFFIIPLPNGTFRIGSSYIREFEDDAPTQSGLEEIVEGAHTILKRPFVVIGQQAGIRPVIPDHRPVIGTHPEHPLVLIMNGLGTKGVSLAPFAAKSLTEFLLSDQEIDQSISVNRFNYLYFRQKNTL
jgi:glycine/D-amino acid oxidase-like deaminating enzyme